MTSMQIYVKCNDQTKVFTVSGEENIKQYIREYFNLQESKFALQINGELYGQNKNKKKFNEFTQNDELIQIEIFDIQQLIQDRETLKSLRNSEINSTASAINSSRMSNIQSQIEQQERPLKNKSDQDPQQYALNSQISLQGSTIYEQTQKCLYCQQDIQEDIIQTPCQHNYHIQCLDQFIYNTLQTSSTFLSCLCNSKFSPQILNFLDEKKKNDYKETLHQNQLFYLQKNYHQIFGRCIDDQKCKFIFIIQNKSKIHQKIQCPFCQ